MNSLTCQPSKDTMVNELNSELRRSIIEKDKLEMEQMRIKKDSNKILHTPINSKLVEIFQACTRRIHSLEH